MPELNNSTPKVRRFLTMIEAAVSDEGEIIGKGSPGFMKFLGACGDLVDDGHIVSYWTLACEDKSFDRHSQRKDVQFLSRMGSALLRQSTERDQRDEEITRLRAQLRDIRAALEGGEA